MSRKVYNETDGVWVEVGMRVRRPNLRRGVVDWDDHHIEFGYYDPTREEVLNVSFPNYGVMEVLVRTATKPVYFDRARGIYSTVEPDNEIVFAHGDFPYTFQRYYSTRYLEEKFQKRNHIESDIIFNHINELPYTFGMEFETSGGYIPERDLFRVGLIPLRDGSITGLEYSTIVLGGNVGLNILKEQIELLKEYTIFDKECSLHIHFGSFNLTPNFLLRLNNLFASSDIGSYAVPWAFETNRYKENGKNYCGMNITFNSFSGLYSSLVGKPFYGNLYQPHPSDLDGNHKWNIASRYKALNLVNAVCYNNAKTVEFRFLRPTYNFDKILTWLFVLGAFVKYAENPSIKATRNISVERVIKSVYSTDLANLLIRAMKLQKEVIQTQVLVRDYYGMRVDIEDQIMTYKNLSKNCKYFY